MNINYEQKQQIIGNWEQQHGKTRIRETVCRVIIIQVHEINIRRVQSFA